MYTTACCAECAGGRRAGLGFVDPATATAVATTGYQLFFGGVDRHAGAACCPRGYNPEGTYPRNAGVGGAPTDYRTKGPPWLGSSRHGFTRTKDDYCNCFPIQHNGRWWALGEIRDGQVYVGPPRSRDNGVWVEVTKDGRRALNVPGFGAVEAAAPEAAAPSGGGTWTPPYSPTNGPEQFGSGGFQAPAGSAPPAPPPGPLAAGLESPWVLGALAVGGGLLLSKVLA